MTNEQLKYISKKIPKNPEFCIMLGSGLDSFIKKINNPINIKYSDIPGMNDTSIEGHKGQFVYGKIDKMSVLCAQGRLHYYEGYSFDEVGLLINIFNFFNPKLCIITNSSGCLNLNWKVGDFMLINNFLDFSFIKNKAQKYGVNQSENHKIILQIAKQNNITINEGTYTFTTGPTYETKSEIKEIIDLGGDAVGMSTFPEFITSKKLNINSIFISCLTNYGAGLKKGEITHQDVLLNANKAKKNFCKLICEIIKNISKNWSTKKN